MKSLLFLAALVSVGAGWQLRQAEEGQDPLAMFIAIDMDGSRDEIVINNQAWESPCEG